MKIGDQKMLQRLISQRTPGQINNVAFFGGADIDKDHPVYKQAYKLARLVAQANKVIINGGGPGVMLAATTGAQSLGGRTYTVAFQPDKKDMPEFSEEANDNHPDIKIVMPDLISRQMGLIKLADLFVVFKGGTGTLSEWTLVWLLAHLQNGHHKPIILYGNFWHEVLDVINRHFLIDKIENKVYQIATTPEEFHRSLLQAEAEIKNRH